MQEVENKQKIISDKNLIIEKLKSEVFEAYNTDRSSHYD
jgi:hypothetical protein